MIIQQTKQPDFLWRGEIISTLLFCFLLPFIFYESHYKIPNWAILCFLLIFILGIRSFQKAKAYEIQNDQHLTLSEFIKAYSYLISLFLILLFFFPSIMTSLKAVSLLVVAFPISFLAINYALQIAIRPSEAHQGSIKYTLVAGTGKLAQVIEKNIIAQNDSHTRVQGFVNCMKNEPCYVGNDKIVGDLKNINQYLETHHVDEIIIALPAQASRKVQHIISAADYHGIRVKFIPDYQHVLGSQYRISRQGKLDVINVRQLPLDERYSFIWKNTFDKVFSAFTLLLLAPIFLVIAILIKLDSPGPVFYCPARIGRSAKPFKVYKFRSMRECDATNGGSLSTQKNDPRVTPIGRFLRKYSIDELPQFINVFLGEMSVVGPRPHRSFLNQELQQCVHKYMIRHYFKPGITGWAQVNGWRGPTDTEEQKRQRTLHDLWYLENWTFALDIKIIFLTIFSKKVHSNAF